MHLIQVRLHGELSTKLDPDDIQTIGPPIGICLPKVSSFFNET